MTDSTNDQAQQACDITVQNGGSILILRAQTETGGAWLDENIQEGAMSHAGGIVIEPRYVEAIIEGAQTDGLTIGEF